MKEQTKLDNAVKISIIVGSLVLALSVAYFLVLYIPQSNRARLVKEQQAKAENAKRLSDCVNSESLKMDETQNAILEDIQKNGTRYEEDTFDDLQRDLQTRKENCYRQYPQ